MTSRAQFAVVQRLLRDAAGIVLEDDKDYLVEVRLGPLARRLGIGQASDLIELLAADSAGELRRLALEAMANSETLFFRDYAMFEMLREELLPSLGDGVVGTRPLRIWSAACSTGQEPYSVAMVADELTARVGRPIEILATDLCRENLSRARAGAYSQFEVNRGLPAAKLVKYFVHDESQWKITKALRDRVEFRELNLVRDPPPAGTFDLVLLRNVMIYWDIPTRSRVLEAVRSALRPTGALILGAAENTHGLHDGFTCVSRKGASYYRPA